MTLKTLLLCDEEFVFFVPKAAEEHKYTHIHYRFVYSGTSLIRTPLGQKKVS